MSAPKRPRGSPLGKAAYNLYFRPMAATRELLRAGVANSWRESRGRGQMIASAERLPAATTPVPADAPNVYLMSGTSINYQTCFLIHSLLTTLPHPVRPVVFDDGSLTQDDRDTLRRIAPATRVVEQAEVEARLDVALPPDKYPRLRGHREVKPHLQKLIDFHAGLTGWKLFLDSDMLFFRRPDWLLNWYLHPRPTYMVDCKTAYGYSPGLMRELAGCDILPLINIGILGLKSETIDWDRTEYWIGQLLDREGAHYNITQCLCAMILSQGDCDVAPKNDYIVLPSRAEAELPRAVLHHYVAESKAWYFRFGWRNVRISSSVA